MPDQDTPPDSAGWTTRGERAALPSLSERLAMLGPELGELAEHEDEHADHEDEHADHEDEHADHEHEHAEREDEHAEREDGHAEHENERAEPRAEPTEIAAAAPAPAGPRARRRRAGWLSVPLAALLVMTLLMGAATGYLWLQVRRHAQTETARQQALDASRDAARLLFSYDYRTLDTDFQTGRALTTGQFRDEYAKTTTKVVTDVAKQYHAVVKANVVTAGVVSATPVKVVTIVYVNQVTTSTRVSGQKIDLSRVRVTLRRIGGRWLVAKVDAL